MSRESSAAALAADISQFIRSTSESADHEAEFDDLSCRIFAYQYSTNQPYRRFCDGRGIDPAAVTGWRDIPAVPAAAFKRFALTCAAESECDPSHGGAIFHSSGTTDAETSRHFMDHVALDLYRVSLRCGFARFVDRGGPERRLLALMPPPAEMPHSSLSFMLGTLAADYAEATFYWRSGWQQALAAALRGTTAPSTIFGTAFAWMHLFDADGEESFKLPAGSVVIETGGFKGRSREVSREELYDLFGQRLGVDFACCVSEYGMSEMASQYYDSARIDAVSGSARSIRKVGPPWLRTRVLDPVTGIDAAPGTDGVLVHYDLANLNSVIALQAEDYGTVADDGEGFVLHGRAPGAVLRGCSLTAEDLHSGSQAGDRAIQANGRL